MGLQLINYGWFIIGPGVDLPLPCFSFYRDPYCAAFCILRPTCINTCVRSARMHTYMCKCAFIHYILVYIYIYIYVYVYIYICMYVCTGIHMHTHIHNYYDYIYYYCYYSFFFIMHFLHACHYMYVYAGKKRAKETKLSILKAWRKRPKQDREKQSLKIVT